MPIHEIAGGHSAALPLTAGARIRLTNTFGTQVVDTWAVAQGDTSEYLSVEQTRRMLFKLHPTKGDLLYSNRRRPLLRIADEQFEGRHDMLVACCDRWLYKHYGCTGPHRNCHDNFQEAMFAAGYGTSLVPNPLNLWMNVPVTDMQESLDL